MTTQTQPNAGARNGRATAPPATIVSLIRDNGVVERALVIALVIGSGLTAVNQSPAVFGDAPFAIPQLILGYLTPFVVVTVSQVLGIRARLREAASGFAGEPHGDALFPTALSHGIPARALFVALAVGTVLTAIMAGLALIEGGGFGDVPTAQIAQVYALPLVFGVVSQSISYRRTAVRAGQGAHE